MGHGGRLRRRSDQRGSGSNKQVRHGEDALAGGPDQGVGAFLDQFFGERHFGFAGRKGVSEGMLNGHSPYAARSIDVPDGQQARPVGGAGVLDLLFIGELQRNAVEEEVERADVDQAEAERLGGQRGRRRLRGGGRRHEAPPVPAGGKPQKHGERKRNGQAALENPDGRHRKPPIVNIPMCPTQNPPNGADCAAGPTAWRAREDSNLRHLGSKPSALSS